MENRKLNELLARWVNKPTFKLEDEPGFEAYREKLLHYRLELQKNANIRALQEKILTEQKAKWTKFPVYSLVDDPELNLFREELQLFCEEMYTTSELGNSMNLLNDIRLAFEDVKEQFAEKSYNEKVRLVRMYKHIDFFLIKQRTPGLENLKSDISKWVEAAMADLKIQD